MADPVQFSFLERVIAISFPSGYYVVMMPDTSADGTSAGGGDHAADAVIVFAPTMAFSKAVPTGSQSYHDSQTIISGPFYTTEWVIWNSGSVGLWLNSLVFTNGFGQPVPTFNSQAACSAYIASPANFTDPQRVGLVASSSTDAGEVYSVNNTIIATIPRAGSVILSGGGFAIPTNSLVSTQSGFQQNSGTTQQNVSAAVFTKKGHIIDPKRSAVGSGAAPWPINWASGYPKPGQDPNVDNSILAFLHKSFTPPQSFVTVKVTIIGTNPNNVVLTIN